MRKYIWFALVLVLLGLFRLVMDAVPDWDGSFLKQLLVPLASLYLTIFSHQLTAIVLSGTIVLSGFVLLVRFRLAQFTPARRALQNAVMEIHQIETLGDGAERLRRLDRIFDLNPYLAREWRNYRRTLLVFPEADSPVWASVRPERYFSLKGLQRSGVDIGLMRSLPSYYVGFGLLFTFMGLVAGLYFASRGLMAADLAAARQSLIQLLHTSTFKFSTSVAGLAMSLLSAIYGRALISRLEQGLDDLCNGLEAVLQPVPAYLNTRIHGWTLEPDATINESPDNRPVKLKRAAE
jgi:hypothetical protein